MGWAWALSGRMVAHLAQAYARYHAKNFTLQMTESQYSWPCARPVSFFPLFRSLWSWVCCSILQVLCQRSRLLAQAKNCEGLHVYHWKWGESFLSKHTKKRIASSRTVWQFTHIISYDRRIPPPLGCSRDINVLARKISVHPHLCYWLQTQLMAPFCHAVTTY